MKQVASSQPAQRGGVTLTEVLMSMMIMAIGVSLVATLFPIAALRSAQATKLTNGAILKMNVEAQLRAQPSLVYDPDGDGNLVEHFRRPVDRNYIIDPIGYYNRLLDGGTHTFARSMGNFYNTTSTSVEPANLLLRFDAGVGFGLNDAAQIAQAERLRATSSIATGLGDSWETVVDDFAESVVASTVGTGVVGVNLPAEIDFSDLVDVDSEGYFSRLGFDPENTRVTVFSIDGEFSESFPVTQFSGTQQLKWTEEGLSDFDNSGAVTARYLPAVFGGEVGRVLVQTKRTNDFNWMLTVRRGGDGRTSGIDVVVMYNDGLDPDDERVHVTPAGEGFEVGDFDISVPAKTADDVEPFVKRGGFVMDVDNARWYRISDYGPDPADSNFILVTLETSPAESSPGGIGHAMFLPTVVEIFPLGGRPIPDGLPRNF